MYDNPQDFINEKQKRRKHMLKKALEYMDKKGEDTEDMTPEEIVEAAEKFDDFVKDS